MQSDASMEAPLMVMVISFCVLLQVIVKIAMLSPIVESSGVGHGIRQNGLQFVSLFGFRD